MLKIYCCFGYLFRTEHLEVPLYNCQFCDQAFFSTEQLRDHVKTHITIQVDCTFHVNLLVSSLDPTEWEAVVPVENYHFRTLAEDTFDIVVCSRSQHLNFLFVCSLQDGQVHILGVQKSHNREQEDSDYSDPSGEETDDD